MSFFFLLNNLHFALEILGALAFLVVAWLAFDSYLLRKDFVTASRGIGFLFLTLWQVLHAFNFPSDLAGYSAYVVYFLGIIFVLWNLLLEAPVPRPEFKAVLVLPGLGAVLAPFNTAAALGLFFIAFLSYRQYKKELKKSLFPFWLGFLFLFLGSLASIIYEPDSLSSLWITGHIFELAGFFALAWWTWSYLALRIREEMLIIFVSFALFVSVIVSLTFSSILITKIEAETKRSLLTNTRVLDFALLRLQEEALAKARLIAARSDLKAALRENNFVKLQEFAESLLEEEKLGFLTIVDKEGYAVLRAHALTKKDDDLTGELAVKNALGGKPSVTIESSPAEKFSIRAASPLVENDKVAGVIIAGFPLDNALADSIRKITGLEMSIFEGNVRVATTALNPDGKTRSTGIKEVNPLVLSVVLGSGGELTLRTTMLSRPFLASYLPIKNAGGEIVGMISAAVPQKEVLETAQATNRLTLIIVMIIMFILIMPIYLITKRLSEEVTQ